MELKKQMRSLKNKEKAKILQRFFKTGEGEYGYGDLFLGVTVPKIRNLVKIYWKQTLLQEIQGLIYSKYHEERLLGLLILVKKYQKSEEKIKKEIVGFYLKNAKQVNNWDLVDLTAYNILGDFLLNKNKEILYKLSKSKNLWEKRISIISTLAFIKSNKFQDTKKISEILLQDKHDLIHKAVGWMLREMGKKDLNELEKFLDKNYKKMSRTTLRYSIEKMSREKRRYYLNKQ